MESNALKKITIEHLRGAVVPFSFSFEKGKKLTVVYGENGTGKSTICDAFEFLSNGKVNSLEGRGLGTTGRYWPSVEKGPSDVSVSIETNKSTCRATISKGNEVVVYPTSARPKAEVFRRSQILKLIEATPNERYAAISRFIDVSGVEASEATLRRLIFDLTKSRDVAVARVHENEIAIQQFWTNSGSSVKDPFLWAKGESKRSTSAFESEAKAIIALQAAYNSLASYPTQWTRAEETLNDAKSALAERRLRVKKLLEKISRDAAEVVGVLQAAHDYLARNPSPSACPLCESSERTSKLAARVDRRLAGFKLLQDAQKQVTSADRLVLQCDQRLRAIAEDAAEAITEFKKFLAKNTLPSDVPVPSAKPPASLSGLSKWLGSSAHLSDEWKEAERVRHDKNKFLSTLRNVFESWRDNTQAQKDLDQLLPRLNRALEIMEEERRHFTDVILSNIAEKVGRLYEIVHPGEGLNKISLELDSKKRASLEIEASFCGKFAKPQAYFSDSHLDTLGLCIFLALSALDEPAETILVLDDVLASVDEPHVDRLIEMLYSETLKFRHCVITTHYRPWKQKLRWGWLKNGQCQFVELSDWSASQGLTLIHSVPDIERLRKLLGARPPDVQLICAKAGVILEAALDFLTLQYECAVPRRSFYTLGDLLPAFSGKLKKALRVDVRTGSNTDGSPVYKTVPLEPFLEELTRISQIRNVFGCHFNELSFDLLDSDALGFGHQVVGLMEALTDGESGWPKNGKSGEYWATAGNTRKLHPYKKPS